MTTLRHEIEGRPDYALLSVHLDPGQKVHAEPSAMVSMDESVTLRAGMKGGLGKALMRSLAGESFIVNTFTAERGGGTVALAPGPMGDLMHHRVTPAVGLSIQRGSYVAHGDGVEIATSWQGWKGLISGEGLLLLKATGDGDVFFNTFGGILPVDVDGTTYVDTGYIVAFENTLQYAVTTLPGMSRGGKWKSFLLGGEGFVCRFSGQGRVWVQSRSPRHFLSFLHAYRPVKRSNS
jgi:uncharacterized protein (TIGR00266 family)